MSKYQFTLEAWGRVSEFVSDAGTETLSGWYIARRDYLKSDSMRELKKTKLYQKFIETTRDVAVRIVISRNAMIGKVKNG